jgi:NitT/TauT family transport system permease protein
VVQANGVRTRHEPGGEEIVAAARSGSSIVHSGRNARSVLRSTSLMHLIRGLCGIVVALTVWQVVASLHLVSPEYLPGAIAVVAYTGHLLTTTSFLAQVGVTICSMVIGLGLSAVVGIPLGLLLGRSEVLYRLSSLLVDTLRPIPAVALAPLAILLFGLSNRATVALVVWTSFWPILINSIYGMHSVDPLPCQTARVFGLTRLQTLVRVELPFTAPFIATGIRISLAIALSVAIAGEMVAGNGGGLGGWVVEESSNGSLTPVYAATLVSGILGYFFNSVMEALERRMFSWHTSFRAE